MTNAIAIGLGAAIIALILLDQLLGTGGGIFAARKLAAFVQHIAFWR
ncbi:hypothetical protein [Profundibacterium mesophilum]|uniref:Uncharacterized protein n=1 Tax=Profundibacterium mesophilum KAUST100406-0324 TaxID=1037889 RepID=A0A921NNC5_9RHOB|nr:hypothetical protein [Profundibacterium mesophilum]KAF0674796.1 hypothetical protein PMES_02872 [Profundibacterium mesophilum KAUST100406-0324]